MVTAPAAERRAALERHVTERAARVLDALPDRLDPERPLIGFGLDSLMAVEFIAAVHRETGVRIQLNDVLRGLSLRDLSAAVHRQLEPAPA
ncbi:MAG: acyl carrier protein [Actinomycetota bacterium]|nr:acyl carrier protein [Actinomycetota bacterium]